MGGLSIDFDFSEKRREKRARSAALLDTYLKDNPDITLAEAQEAMDQVDQTGELPDTFSTGRKLSAIRGKRKAYFNQNKDTGLLEPVDLGDDVTSGRADPTILPYNPPTPKTQDENAPGRLITQGDDGQFSYVDARGQEVPLGSDGSFGGVTKRDRIVRKPRAGGGGRAPETPAQKAARDTIQKYMAAVDDYADPADIPESLTKNMRTAARSLGMSVQDVTDVVTKRNRFQKFIGMKDVTRTTPVIDFSGQGAGDQGQAGGGPDQGQDMTDGQSGADGGDQGDQGQDEAPVVQAPASGRRGAPSGGARGVMGGYANELEIQKAYRSGKITKEKALRLLGF